jgi:hypothetical protein
MCASVPNSTPRAKLAAGQVKVTSNGTAEVDRDLEDSADLKYSVCFHAACSMQYAVQYAVCR